ncbi:dipeptide/oligopeptide/nickel ABC transporter permease/ATP-binding protein [Rahnella aquatilis]|jgi:peptide/nickel transport system permease protein|uniref:dipeptide/oligopeptide/nickel ABC transporter permease/ATP-binding protein n=1 Tax=Rahnella TaxID=34037 RepID=UPI000EB5138D|nr:dipeptide/oligopeptide/nickel ABC transporter permease/ATP-binding protein [Rahnella aceris]AZP41777.1 dipeptide/oligopeptide/nickel ABC transporter permease/ATP-binding protein [Rahnella aquatilis]AZP46118.1 dipeptide/oligopeptide/nickel ABC transporter permease/ATP-binding protein [Rahnella aquatilis]MBU9865201.1 dipeptide/oligopeptide/nickel ABC transporter permease/ATP-binding protein [Rahnella aceris]MDP9704240.1 peptide/nickel transport system permease protein [Rahnella aquatilis]RKT8
MSQNITTVTPRHRQPLWALLLANRLATLGLIMLVLVAGAALAAPLLPLPDPDATDLLNRLLRPFSPGHWLGTDPLGRDMLSRLLWGTRVSLAMGVCATLLAALFGTLIGLVAGYAGGKTDSLLMRLIDMLMAFPYILLALVIVTVLGPGLLNALYAISVVNIPFFARNIRGLTVGLRQRDFIQAARLSGKNHLQILLTEVLPNMMPVVVVTMSTTVGWMILETAGLSFLGLGTQPPNADLGSMLGQGRAQMFSAPHVSIVPGLTIFILVMSFNLLGDGVRDLLDPRLKSGILLRGKAVTTVNRASVPSAIQGKNALLEVVDLQVNFRSGKQSVAAVKGVSFYVAKGECLGLIGESGSGKSVTALSVMGLVSSPPGEITAGAIYVGGEEMLSRTQSQLQQCRGARVAYIFQDPLTTLHPQFSIGAQIIEAIQAHQPLSNRLAKEKALTLLHSVGIDEAAARFDAFPHQLSGGQRQRVGIAVALANDPEIIIADEPTTALDVTVQARILELLQQLRRERGLTLLFITHDFSVIAQICDRVAVMRNGEIVESGETRSVLRDPQHDYTRRLIASVPKLGQGRDFLKQVGELYANSKPQPGAI